MDKMIKIWRFHDAPEELKALSPHCGDEDYLAVVPPDWDYFMPLWLQYGSFGCCDISEHKLPDGSTVFIGAHA